MTNNVKGFYDEGYEDAVRGNHLPLAYYHLRITANLGETEFSTEARPAVHLETEVASGEYEGRRGPRITLQLGAWDWVNPKSGKTVSHDEDEMYQNLKADVRAIHGATPPVIPAGVYGLELLDATADALVADEFFAKVSENKNGFQVAGYYRDINDPPKGFVLSKDRDEFRV
jgi:hypothetical protein